MKHFYFDEPTKKYKVYDDDVVDVLATSWSAEKICDMLNMARGQGRLDEAKFQREKMLEEINRAAQAAGL